MKVLAILNDGFEDLEANGTIIILRRAGFLVDVCAFNGKAKGRYAEYTMLGKLEEINYNDYDLLFLPGGGYIPNTLTKEAIKFFYQNNKYLAAICSGPTYLGELGILRNRNYVCFPNMNQDFGGNFMANEYVVYDNRVFTARSVAASFKLPFKIVETLCGKEKLAELKKQMCYID